MTEVVSVKFKDGGKAYYFDPDGISFSSGDKVIIETANGISFGFVSHKNHSVSKDSINPPLKKVLRKANERDFKRLEENARREKEALKICKQKIEDHKLVMNLVSVEYSFDGSKITFFFTADGRVDFRELVKDLAAQFHTRIELRQIGVRDEARLLGGLGICGQPYCCKQFLDDFQPVSIKMAKEQGLSLNPIKISGSCGRLMCCLKYEQNAYDDLIHSTPCVGATVKTDEGIGTVVEVNLISGYIFVKPKDSETALPYKVHKDEAKVISRSKKAPKSQDNGNQSK